MRSTQLSVPPAAPDRERQGAIAACRRRGIPHISIHAFCEDRETAETLQAAAADRRLARADMEVCIGGMDAAIARCAASPAPDLLVVETTLPRAQMLTGLARLAQCCGPATKAMVIGQVNDVALYRALLKRGIAEYMLAPVSSANFVESVASLFGDRGSEPVGSIIAFAGAKGGVGSSTVCHNVAWAISEALRSDVVVVDLDLAFGTASLNFNQDPARGIAEALEAPHRLDAGLLDQVLTRCSQRLSILAAPLALDREYGVCGDACDALLDALRHSFPFAAVDLPHAWTPPVKRMLLEADDVVLTAAPDLANLRNARNLVDALRSSRCDGRRPHLVINMVKAPRRPDISVKEFRSALDLDPAQVIEFDGSTFGCAANNGQMIEEFSPKAKAAQQFRALAFTLARRAPPEQDKRPSALAPILERLGLPVFAREVRPFSTAGLGDLCRMSF